ncbi:uncharacterized protein LOC142170181 [Nicotiana tabacum]|uniref:Uncharacterized protein LOC142170181 n=1 Tax=Nicotiana tabacum TaxID=4097 RepID=A0AC58ST29_TOBAC
MFAFTSLEVNYDRELAKRNRGIYTFRVQGQMYHFIDDLVPSRATGKFLQLYFYDNENELTNRMALSDKINETVIKKLMDILKVNPYSSFLRSLRDVPNLSEFYIALKSNSSLDQRTYNLPTASKVGAIIWIEDQTNDRISTPHIRIYTHSNRSQVEVLQGIIDLLRQGERDASNIGKKIFLPGSFIGGPRDMRRRYMDAIVLVQRFGKPDILLTMTCNPSWPEIQEHLLPTDEVQNRPDLIGRVFRAKVEELKADIKKKNIFGKVAAFMYTIEFQKRRLPHVHFLIILKDRYKLLTPQAYDKIVRAELPDRNTDPDLYKLVIKYMIHGPCGYLNPTNSFMEKNIQKKLLNKQQREKTYIHFTEDEKLHQSKLKDAKLIILGLFHTIHIYSVSSIVISMLKYVLI